MALLWESEIRFVYVLMVKWKLYFFALFSLLSLPVVLAQEAFDDEAYEESRDAKDQRLEAEFQDALSLINEGGLGKGLKEIKRLAVAGHARSQYMLGMFFRYGTGVRKSAKRSAQWLKLGSDQRYPAAMLAYAETVLSGDGVRRDYELARELLEPLVAKDWNFPVPMEDFGVIRSIRSQSSAMLGGLLVEGKGGSEDYERAILLMKQASDTGYFYASMFLALEYAKGDRCERDLKLARTYFDLVELQVMDSVRRELEKVMMGIVDPVVEEEIREGAEEMGQRLAEELIDSQRILGQEFLKEASDDYNPEIAAALLKMASDGEDSIAQSILGQLYWKGLGVEQDQELAKELFAKAAEGNSTVGRYCSAILILSESKDAEELKKAKESLEDAAQNGHFAAQLALDGEEGLSILSEDEDLALAEEWEKRGDARAQFSLTKRAERGWGLERERKPMKLYKGYLASAKQGYHRAEHAVGRAFFDGKGPAQNYKKALGWFERAAEQDNALSYFRIGYMYSNGLGVPVDYALAAAYYEKAVEKGDAAAMNNLANFYFEGKGVEKSEAKAFELYEIAAGEDEVVACYNIGKKYLVGDGVELREEEGVEWLAKSGEGGYLSAVLRLCEYYQEGRASSDFVELAYWREKAAEAGDRKSMKETAVFYQKGVGVPVSNLKAMYWISAYINMGRSNNVRMRNELLQSEKLSAVQGFLPLDYEAILVYVSLLKEGDWAGHDLEVALKTASLFEKTDLFAGRLLLAELHLAEGVKGAKPKLGLRLYRKVFEEAVQEKRFLRHAVSAAYKLAKEYGSGRHVEKDAALCTEWMKRAADIGYRRAQLFYADFLWDGVGCEQNRDMAMTYFVHLSDSGYDKATLRLGELFVIGEVGEAYRSLLEERLTIIMDKGNERARSILKSMGVELAPAKEPEDKDDSSEQYYRPTVLG